MDGLYITDVKNEGEIDGVQTSEMSVLDIN